MVPEYEIIGTFSLCKQNHYVHRAHKVHQLWDPLA